MAYTFELGSVVTSKQPPSLSAESLQVKHPTFQERHLRNDLFSETATTNFSKDLATSKSEYYNMQGCLLFKYPAKNFKKTSIPFLSSPFPPPLKAQIYGTPRTSSEYVSCAFTCLLLKIPHNHNNVSAAFKIWCLYKQ